VSRQCAQPKSIELDELRDHFHGRLYPASIEVVTHLDETCDVYFIGNDRSQVTMSLSSLTA